MNPRERAEHALRLLPFTQEARDPFVESVELEIIKAEHGAVGKSKGIEEIVEDTILLLKALSEGQGYARVEVFDVGVAGGFESGRLLVEHLRDGKGIDKEVRGNPQILKQLILDVLQVDNSMPFKMLANVTWDDYVARSEM